MLGVVLHLFPERAFDFVGACEHLLDAAKLLDEFDGGFFAHAGTAGHVVGGIAHECEHVDDLRGGGESVFAANALFIEFFGLGGAVAWTVHDDVGSHELGVVLVGRDHVHLESALGRLQGQCADDVVGLEARHLE